MPSISSGTKKRSYVPTAKGKLLDSFKDGRRCSVLYGDFEGFFFFVYKRIVFV